MDDIIVKDRVKLNIETYEGLAMTKSHIKAAERTVSMMNISAALRSLCLSSYDRYKDHLKKKKEKIKNQVSFKDHSPTLLPP